MDLYLIRHGIAVERGIYERDCDRPLTDKGRDRTGLMAQRLVELGLKFDQILTSPFLRASQTADILFKAGLGGALETSDLLVPDSSLTPWLAWLKASRSALGPSLALVGHEPNWSEWTEQLVFGQAVGHLRVKKAGVIGLVLPEQISPLGNSELFWFSPPRLLI
jgi:phosphohistidine phosphatase